MFKIEVKNFQSQRFDRSRFEASYRVKRVCTDEDIIRQFQKMQLENTVCVKIPSICYSFLTFSGPDVNAYDMKVGASSSRVMVTPESNMKHGVVAKVGKKCFLIVSLIYVHAQYVLNIIH